MGWDVFLSYHGSDRELARRLRDVLIGAGQRVFFDETSILPGEVWQRALEAGMQGARSCLVLLTGAAPERWVHAEVRLAITRAVADPGFRLVPVCTSSGSATVAVIADRTLLVGFDDGSLLTQVEKERPSRRKWGHAKAIDNIVVGDEAIWTRAVDGTMRQWDRSALEETSTGERAVDAVAFNAQGLPVAIHTKYIIGGRWQSWSGSDEGDLEPHADWDIAACDGPSASYRPPAGSTPSITAAGTQYGVVTVRSMESTPDEWSFQLGSETIDFLAFNQQGTGLAVIGYRWRDFTYLTDEKLLAEASARTRETLTEEVLRLFRRPDKEPVP
ncbi:MAG: hypothetical protein AMXMBFR64_17760 [Myxococcales bacterium]